MKQRFATPKTKGSLAISIAAHVVMVVALFSIVFRYPLGQLMGIRQPDAPVEKLTYIAVQRPPEASTAPVAGPPKSGSPARLVAPRVTPTQLPMPAATADAPSRAAGGSGDGFGVAGSGMATGIVPGPVDPRIRLSAPDMVYRVPRGVSQDVDSIIDMAIGIAIDSIEVLKKQGRLPEWVKTDKNGNQWGITPQYIVLGKLKIPTALLALLPLNMGPAESPIDARRRAYIRQDVLENAQRSITEDEFRQSVKRIRERKERERKEADDKKKTAPPVVAPDPKLIPAPQQP